MINYLCRTFTSIHFSRSCQAETDKLHKEITHLLGALKEKDAIFDYEMSVKEKKIKELESNLSGRRNYRRSSSSMKSRNVSKEG